MTINAMQSVVDILRQLEVVQAYVNAVTRTQNTSIIRKELDTLIIMMMNHEAEYGKIEKSKLLWETVNAIIEKIDNVEAKL